MEEKLNVEEETKAEEPKLIVNPTYHKFLMEEELNRIFGEECVDFKDTTAMIHFPELEISNSEGRKHTIYDLYVSLYFSFNADKNVDGFTNSIEGFRTTLTYAEAYVRYIHSHLPSISQDEEGEDNARNRVGSEDFCLGGSSDITSILSALNMQFTMEQFTILLYSLEDFVRWESLTGGPYELIKNIPSTSSSYEEIKPVVIAPSKNQVELFYKVVNINKFKELGFYPDKIQTNFSSKEEIEQLIEDTLQPYVGISFSPSYKYEDKYYNLNQGTEDLVGAVDNMDIEIDYPSFKDEWPTLDIISPPKEEEMFTKISEGAIKVIQPGLTMGFYLTLELDLHNHLNNTDTWKLKKELIEQ